MSGLAPSAEFNGLPFGLLLLLTGVYFPIRRKLDGTRVWPAISIAASIIFLSVLPTPAYQQYFCVAVPFLIVSAVFVAWSLPRRGVGMLPLLVVLLANLWALPGNLCRYTSTGEGLVGLLPPSTATDWQLSSVQDISRELDRITAPGEVVLSFWPGYLFDSHAAAVPGMETHVGLSIANKLTPAQLTQYRILSAADIEARLKMHDPCVAVVGSQESMRVDAAPFEKMLQSNGYRVAHRVGHASIYTCK